MPLSSLEQLGCLSASIIQFYKQLIFSTEAEMLDEKNQNILILLQLLEKQQKHRRISGEIP